MQYGTSEKGKHGAISRRETTDYHLAWITWLKTFDAMNVAEHLNPDDPDYGGKVVSFMRDNFDAGWDARGLADLNVIKDTLSTTGNQLEDLSWRKPSG